MTNADKIRAMTDKELELLLMECESAGYNDTSITPKKRDGYHMAILEWLQETVDE